ncbi:DUF6705 family protein [Psychroserpens sp. XS_ASV72]|uniref:DUF6705 family protein n=1 Tax=Psychroserpens sp. XS_ASV72 TaxID=3241293 RepID=UPI003512129B
MNRGIIVLYFFLAIYSCKSQIIPLTEYYGEDDNGAYYKDVDNDLDKFVGTWKWEDGNNSLTVTFIKEENMQSTIGNSSYDILAGEYRYEENGQILANYLIRLNDSSITDPDSHYISGNTILFNNHKPPCDTCEQGERRLYLNFNDPTLPYLPLACVLRHKTINAIEQIEMDLFLSGSYIQPTGLPDDSTVPMGRYTLLKK